MAQVQVLKQVGVLAVNPYAGKPLRGDWKGVYSLRKGKYRVLYEVRGDTVLLLSVKHRKHVY